MNNYTEKRKYKRIELGIRKYREIVTPYIARFRDKQCIHEETSSFDWSIVAVKNLSAGGIMFDYYKNNLNIGSMLELKLDFVRSMPIINCVGMVIRIEENPYNSMFRIATEFTEIDEKEREIINITVEAILRKEVKRKMYFEKLMKMKNVFTGRSGIAKAMLESSKTLKTCEIAEKTAK